MLAKHRSVLFRSSSPASSSGSSSSLCRAFEKSFALGLGLAALSNNLAASKQATPRNTTTATTPTHAHSTQPVKHLVKLCVRTAAFSGVCEAEVKFEADAKFGRRTTVASEVNPLVHLIDQVERLMSASSPLAAQRAELKFFHRSSSSSAAGPKWSQRRWTEVETSAGLAAALAQHATHGLTLLVVDAADPATDHPLLDSGDYYPDLKDEGAPPAPASAPVHQQHSPKFHDDPASKPAAGLESRIQSLTHKIALSIAHARVVALEAQTALLSEQLRETARNAEGLARQLARELDARDHTPARTAPARALSAISTQTEVHAAAGAPSSKVADQALAHQHVRRRCTLLNPARRVAIAWEAEAGAVGPVSLKRPTPLASSRGGGERRTRVWGRDVMLHDAPDDPSDPVSRSPPPRSTSVSPPPRPTSVSPDSAGVTFHLDPDSALASDEKADSEGPSSGLRIETVSDEDLDSDSEVDEPAEKAAAEATLAQLSSSAHYSQDEFDSESESESEVENAATESASRRSSACSAEFESWCLRASLAESARVSDATDERLPTDDLPPSPSGEPEWEMLGHE